MGIDNIHILINDDDVALRAQQIQTMRAEYFVEVHRRGEHPLGDKQRECPLCQQGK